MKFGDILKELRISHNMTQRHIASLVSLSPSVYSRFENNERKVKREMLIKFSSIYQIEECELYRYWIVDKIFNLLEGVQNPLEILLLVENSIRIKEQGK